MSLDILPELDKRNLIPQFKGLPVDEIVEQLDQNRHRLHIAIENWEHDFNIGSIVRSSNAFNVASVNIIGKRRWNKRGAMMTDVYMHVYHHQTIQGFEKWANGECPSDAVYDNERAPQLKSPLKIVGIDCLDNISSPIENVKHCEDTVFIFGTEGTGLSSMAQQIALKSSGQILHITQYGSTRSINAAHAASIAMYDWVSKMHR